MQVDDQRVPSRRGTVPSIYLACTQVRVRSAIIHARLSLASCHSPEMDFSSGDFELGQRPSSHRDGIAASAASSSP